MPMTQVNSDNMYYLLNLLIISSKSKLLDKHIELPQSTILEIIVTKPLKNTPWEVTEILGHLSAIHGVSRLHGFGRLGASLLTFDL